MKFAKFIMITISLTVLLSSIASKRHFRHFSSQNSSGDLECDANTECPNNSDYCCHKLGRNGEVAEAYCHHVCDRGDIKFADPRSSSRHSSGNNNISSFNGASTPSTNRHDAESSKHQAWAGTTSNVATAFGNGITSIFGSKSQPATGQNMHGGAANKQNKQHKQDNSIKSQKNQSQKQSKKNKK